MPDNSDEYQPTLFFLSTNCASPRFPPRCSLEIQIPTLGNEGSESDGGVAVDGSMFVLNGFNMFSHLSKLEAHEITPWGAYTI